jgi:hypothetical protein
MVREVKQMRKDILEAKDVCVYKKLLNTFGDYCDKNPATGVDHLFELLVEKGKKILPSDKRAMDILCHLLADDTSSSCVQNILNTRFRDLPAQLKPVTKSGKRHELAFWCVDKQVFDQTRKLLNFEGKGKGFWSDADCKKVTLLDTKEKENECSD